MTNARRIAGLKGAAKRFQRASAANYSDIAYWWDAFWLDGLSTSLKHDIQHYQGWHAENSARARQLLFKLIGEKP